MSESIGDRLRALRSERGLTLQQVAKAAEVAVSSVSGWESNQAAPRAESLGKLVAALGLDLEALILGGPPRQARTFDWDLLFLIEATLDNWAEGRGVMLSPAQRHQLIPQLYRLVISARSDERRDETVRSLLDLVAA